MKILTVKDILGGVSMMTGLSSLIFSGITWQNTEVAKKDIRKHHDALRVIPDLKSFTNDSLRTLKRLDKDIGILFADLGKYNERTKATKIMMLKSRNKTKKEIRKTHEKIKFNSETIENYYKNLNSRLVAVESGVKKNKQRIENTNKFLEAHGKNVSRT